MYHIKKILDKQESVSLFELLTQSWEIKPFLGIVNPEGNFILHYPEPDIHSAETEYPYLKDHLQQKTYLETGTHIYSPFFIGDNYIGSLVSKNNNVTGGKSLSSLAKLLTNLLTKQINYKLERKEILRETLDTYKEINLLYKIGDSISDCLDVDELAKTILRESSKIIKTESCSLMLLNNETGQLEIKSARGDKNNHRLNLKLGTGIAGIVAQEAKHIISNDVIKDPRFIPGGKNIRSLICVPLKTRHKVLGVVNFSNKLDGGIFTARDAKLVSAMTTHASNFIENAILHQQKLNEDRLKRNLERYLSPHLASDLMENKQELELGGVKKTVAVLFADIRKFTSLSEELEPEVLVKFLNEYFTHMVDIIFKYGGTVDKFVGDEIMAIFGAPITHPDDDIKAIKTAIEMQTKMKSLQKEWAQKKMPIFSIGIGINSGEVITGNIGSEKHMDYTVIGDVVNTANRLETKATGGQILISRNVYNKTKNLYKFKEFGEILVKGKKKPVEVFEVLC